MTEQRSARNVRTPLIVTLELAVRAALERDAAERRERRAKMRLVDGGARRDAA